MTKSELKQWQREHIYKKITRFCRMYSKNATDTLLNLGGGLVVAVGLSTPFVIAGIIQ